jgi:hypothetical protein
MGPPPPHSRLSPPWEKSHKPASTNTKMMGEVKHNWQEKGSKMMIRIEKWEKRKWSCDNVLKGIDVTYRG